MSSDFVGLWGMVLREQIPFRKESIYVQVQKVQQEIKQTTIGETTAWSGMYPFRDTGKGSTTCCDSSETGKEETL